MATGTAATLTFTENDPDEETLTLTPRKKMTGRKGDITLSYDIRESIEDDWSLGFMLYLPTANYHYIGDAGGDNEELTWPVDYSDATQALMTYSSDLDGTTNSGSVDLTYVSSNQEYLRLKIPFKTSS